MDQIIPVNLKATPSYADDQFGYALKRVPTPLRSWPGTEKHVVRITIYHYDYGYKTLD